MNIVILFLMLLTFFYTAGFARELWKDKNKLGAFAVFGLALVVVIAPFFTVLR